MEVVLVPQLSDNYGYLLVDPKKASAAVVDCADAGPVAAALEEHGLKLEAILSTHHHFDHVGGNLDLLDRLGPAWVYGSQAERDRVPGITDPVSDGSEFTVAGSRCQALLIPAHTSGHLAYFFPDAGPAVFCGDTLFVGGCGRIFEGSAEQMLASLSKLAALPGDTRVYCGHEYTETNLRFALTLEPGNKKLKEKLNDVEKLRQQGKATVPSTIAEEKEINPFLRWHSKELQASIARAFSGTSLDPVTVLARTRDLKDRF